NILSASEIIQLLESDLPENLEQFFLFRGGIQTHEIIQPHNIQKHIFPYTLLYTRYRSRTEVLLLCNRYVVRPNFYYKLSKSSKYIFLTVILQFQDLPSCRCRAELVEDSIISAKLIPPVNNPGFQDLPFINP
ncbi:hypothetical protein C0J52_28305, partial [Blattella germanica]